MLELNTIADFQALPLNLQGEVQKALRTKDRLEDFLRTLNKKAGQEIKPTHAAHWEQCDRCKGTGVCNRCLNPDYPGYVFIEESRNDADIHPSQINKCLKMIWYSCNGHVGSMEEYVDPRIRLIFDMGSAVHDMMQRYGRQGAWGDPSHYHKEERIDPDALTFDGKPVHPLANSLWIRGSADALIDKYVCNNVPGIGDVSVRIVHEYKTINSNGYSKLTRPKPEHKYQATIYSAVFNAPLVVYIYLNKDNCQIHDFPVPFDNTIWNEVVAKIGRVQHYTNLGEMPPWEETSVANNQQECLECGYRKICAPPLSQITNNIKRQS